jgi:HD superfamily phosphohydrolase
MEMSESKDQSGFWGFIKDPLYGYIRLRESEKSVIDTTAVQRLRRIKQLSGAEYVYPAANHTRFEHSLGALYLAGTLASSLPVRLKPDDIKKLRIAALLHDVGHSPFSHLFEPTIRQVLGKTHEDLGTWIITKSDLSDTLRKEGIDPEEMGKLAVGLLKDGEKPFMNQIIRSSVDVDKMDFVLRDSYHTGAGYGIVDVFRLIYTMDVLDGDLAVNSTAIPTLETFLLARLESFRTIYFHRASRAAQIMVQKALENAEPELKLLSFKTPDEYLAMDDYSVWFKLKSCTESRPIIDDLENRRLIKCCYEKTSFAKDELISSVLTNDSVRKNMEQEIARKAKVDPEQVYIDVPSLPSVPYHYAMQIEPMDIPVFHEARDGKKVRLSVSGLSQIIGSMQLFMNIVRVYTVQKHRNAVMKASEEILGKPTISSQVSY